MSHRPAFWLAVAFAAGIALCKRQGLESVLPPALISIAFALAGALIPQPLPATGATLLAAVSAGVFAFAYCERSLEQGDLRVIFGDRPVRVLVRGTLADAGAWEMEKDARGAAAYRSTARLRIRGVELPRGWVSVRGLVRATIVSEEPFGLACGGAVEAAGTLRRVRRATNPGQFDARAFWHRRGVDYTLSVRGRGNLRCDPTQRAQRLPRWVAAARGRLKRGLETGVPACAAQRLIAAMLLGYRENIGEELTRPFRLTNTYHIIAISGLNVGFVYLMIRAALRALRVPPRLSSMLSIPVIGAHALITGAEVPVVRATFMFIVFVAAPLIGRRGDAINSIGVAALALLGANALDLFDAGFQLSFAAVLSVLLLARPLGAEFERRFRCGPLPGQLLVTGWDRVRWRLARQLIALWAASIAAWVGLAPLIAGTFNIVTFLGLLGNTVVVPAGFAVVCLGFAGALSSLVCGAAACAFNRLNLLAASSMAAAIRLIARIPCSWYYAAAPGPGRVIAYYALVAAGAAYPGRRGRAKAGALFIAAAAALLLPAGAPCGGGLLRIVFLDVGQGDAAYLEFAGGENMLIDGGPDEGAAAGRRVITPLLRQRGRARVDTVVLTHPHDDHCGGLPEVISEFAVRRLVIAGWADTSLSYRRLARLAKERGVELIPVARGDVLARGPGLRLTVLNPGARQHCGTPADANNNSIALRVDYGGVRVLFCADMEREAEEELCRAGADLRADVVRIGHHGGNSSCTEDFLRRVAPRWAVISAGENNAFGHPHAATIARLRARGSAVLRTDLHGAVTLTTDGARIDIAGYN